MIDLSGISDEFDAIVGQRHAASAAMKDCDAQFLFQLANGARQGRLGDIQKLGRLIERAGFGYNNRVMKLLQGHAKSISRFVFGVCSSTTVYSIPNSLFAVKKAKKRAVFSDSLENLR